MDRSLLLLCLVAQHGASSASPSASAPAVRPLPSSVLTPDGRVRYFAFGSNLLLSKFTNRTTDAPQGSERMVATVANYRLAFNMRMFPPLEPAMASLEPSAGDACEGALYLLALDSYNSLYRSEGGAMARPPYDEIVVPCTTCEGEMVNAITLRAAAFMRLRRDAPPSTRYLSLIRQGAAELGLSAPYRSRLERIPSIAPSSALAAIARAHGVVTITLFRFCPKLRPLLNPLRIACYAATYAGPVRALTIASELAIGTLLLPTAALGVLIRVIRTVLRLPPLTMSMGPPQRPPPRPQSDTQGQARILSR